MLPRIDLPEVVLEVTGGESGFIGASTAARAAGPDGRPGHQRRRLPQRPGHEHRLSAGGPQGRARPGTDRLSYVTQTYFGADNLGAANAPLISRRARIAFAQALGRGLVAAVDGMRFVVPLPSVYARPNREYFGSKRGVTWLNVVSGQAARLAIPQGSPSSRCLFSMWPLRLHDGFVASASCLLPTSHRDSDADGWRRRCSPLRPFS